MSKTIIIPKEDATLGLKPSQKGSGWIGMASPLEAVDEAELHNRLSLALSDLGRATRRVVRLRELLRDLQATQGTELKQPWGPV